MKTILHFLDINVVGETLGYEWNHVCDVLDAAEFYPDGGECEVSIGKKSIIQYQTTYPILFAILSTLFEQHQTDYLTFMLD